MRYEIGQTIFAVQFSFNTNGTNIKHFKMPFLINDDVPDQINFIRMAVAEHHKVPGEWDDTVKYDGFILKDKDNVKYANQYPRAAYGQISDSGDRRFKIHVEREDETFAKVINGEIVYEFHLLTDVLKDMRMGVYDLENSSLNYTAKKAVLLKSLLEKTIEQFNKEFPEYELTYSENNDGLFGLEVEYKIEYKKA